jgi:hypothetical protein
MASYKNNLSITTDQIYKSLDDITAIISLPEEHIKMRDESKIRKERELLLLSKNPIYTIEKTLENKSVTEIHKTVNNFYNADIIVSLLNTTDTIFYCDSHITGLSKNTKIRYMIKNLPISGITSDLFIIKLPTNIDDDLQHELFVALYGINPIRYKVPNFSYIFGGLKCARINFKSETLQIHTNLQNINCVLYENIIPHISMKQYVQTCRGIDFVNKYMQIIYALREAYLYCEFTHYDLHSDNVLIRDVLKIPSAIPYDTERGKEYLLTDKLAIIINYENSYIKYKDISYGVSGLPHYGVSATASYPMHDAYKLLGFCMYAMLEAKNIECFNVASRIMRFFNPTEDLISIIISQRQILYMLPSDSAFKNINYDTFIKYIRDATDIDTTFIVSDPKKTPIIKSGYDGISISYQNTIENINLEENIIPHNFHDFYDLSIYYLKENKTAQFNKLRGNFNYENAKSQILDQIETHLKTINLYVSKLIAPYITNYKDALRDDVLSLFKLFVRHTMKVFDAFYDLRILEQLFQNMIKLYENPESQNILPQRSVQIFSIYKDTLLLYTYLSDASKTISNVVNLLTQNVNDRKTIIESVQIY